MTRLLEKASDFADIPKDVTMGWAKLTFIGHKNLQVDNYRGLLFYSQQNIRLAAKTTDISIAGRGLVITRIEADTVFIEGEIERTEFIHKGTLPKEKSKKDVSK